MDSLLVGGLLALGFRYFPQILSIFMPWIGLVSGIILLIILIKAHPKFPVLLYYSTNTDIFFGVLLLYSISETNNILKRIMEMPWLRMLGKYSYGLYILNEAVLHITDHQLSPFIPQNPYWAGLGHWTIVILALMILFLLSAVSLWGKKNSIWTI